ncbi:thioesterase II family protein [Tenacibaculum halocynthiae]|uniref:thioesterase II family protein n=1 Tax=Tenacibaculum halocynthiae TaxID=1254437 RepID=UPI003D64C1C9
MEQALTTTKTKIIALPYAGGNKYCYRAIQEYVPKDIEWVTLELPGRGERFTEVFIETINEMAEDLFVQLISAVGGSEYIIFGHSMGTLLGYELLKKAREEKFKLPNSLFFTGRGAPEYDKIVHKKSQLSEKMFWKEVNEMGGLPKEILANKSLLNLYYPILKSDFKSIENYKYKTGSLPFMIPIQVCLGTEEIGEGKNKTTIAEMKAWGKVTSGPCSFEVLHGDHFFIFKHPKAIVQKLCYAVEKSKQLSVI